MLLLSASIQQKGAKKFVERWVGKGYEKGETQRFWLELLHALFGIENPMSMMEFELPVKTITKEKGSDFIDAYIPSTKVLIEQKGSHMDLSAKYRQSDGQELTPYQQARRYAAGLPLSMAPRWIVACNFQTFEVHDMERPNDAPEIIQLADLAKEYHRLSFLVDDANAHIKKELEVSIQAGEIVGVLYEKLLAQYIHPDDPESQKSLNKLCVRLVFCLYAEDAGILGAKNMFHDYMSQFSVNEFRKGLIELFKVLDTCPEDRDPYMDEQLAAFPFVSGGMFAGDIEIPRITEEIRTLILQRASDDFDWSLISPTIFGAVFESTLNPETRRSGGMHYTSLENIHKVIDPLFLDDLKAELADIKAIAVKKTKKDRARQFQDKLASLRFLDPACGSGNFLTESYTCLRRLENEVIKILYEDRVIGELMDPIKVSIYQFYGIEINDFACSVSQAALWIAETQMLQETDAIVGFDLDPFPLKDYANIHEGNALRMDWNEVIPARELNYIMGNPPFIGEALRSKEQSDDMAVIFGKGNPETKLDYVLCWYKKAQPFILSGTKVAFVSTNSICQGESVPTFWQNFMTEDIEIFFAHQSFKWDSEASQKAAVWCVIVGLRKKGVGRMRLYNAGDVSVVEHINPYLYPAPDIWIESRSNNNLCSMPKITKGSEPTDGGNLFLSLEEKDAIIKKYPALEKYIRPFVGAKEYIHGQVGAFTRFCFWFVGANPKDFVSVSEVTERLRAIKEFRLASSADRIQKKADYPYLFCQIRQPDSHYMIIPRHTSSERDYIPLGYLPGEVICGDANNMIPEASNYMFGVMESSVHMYWMKVVCGRLGMGYRYSPAVYNNFPWPSPTDAQKEKISSTAQAILDARALYPDSSLGDLYDALGMPPELRKAHRSNDAAVMEAYGFRKDMTEPEIVAELFKMYQILVDKK